MKKLVALLTITLLCASASAEESTNWTSALFRSKMNLPGANWAISIDGNRVTGYSSDGLTAFEMQRTEKTKRKMPIKQALISTQVSHKQRFSFISASNEITCGARNGFAEFCFQRHRGFIERSGWSSQGEMIVFAARVGSLVITGAVYSAQPIHARHYVEYMFGSLKRR
ncbi:MAG: hypothetical protein KC609_10885 [Myxococcales bacterium]|nr:hypothetical protein [Myxococcales bacterium]